MTSIPYTYYVKHLPTGLKYYGSKYSKNADPKLFWTKGGYYTSSIYVKKLIQEWGENSFKVKVTRTFNTLEEALAHEYRFIEKVNAVKRDDWLNKNNGGKKFYNAGPDSEETKKKKSAIVRTPESNKKRSLTLTGVPKPDGFSKKLSLAQHNRPAEKEKERCEKIRIKATGRGHTEETSKLISKIVSDTRWVKKDAVQIKVHVSELDNYLNNGWIHGRILKTVTCPHCGKSGVKHNIVRNHFDKCKNFIHTKE